jgi:hypothetical protein
MYDIYTPMGSLVVTFLMCESGLQTRQAFDAIYTQSYPNATQLTTYDGCSSTRKFNCHGYAWLRVEQGIDRWIGTGWSNDITDPENIYMTDGSYTQVFQATFPGKVSWASGDHSAVTTAQSGVFISKWNEYPLMRHAWNYSPYGTSNLKYYKYNTNITGSANICSSATFTVGAPPASYTWNKSSNLTLSSTSGNTATFTANGTGPAWISVLVNGQEVARKTVYAGILQTADFSGSCGGPETGSSGLFFGSVRSSYSVNEFEWSTYPGWTVVSHPDFPNNIPMGNVRITRTSSSAYTTTPVWVRARNGCGWSSEKQIGTLSSSSYYTVSAYPNPVLDVLNLLIEEEETTGSSRTGVKPVYTIHLYSIMGGTPVLQTSANEAGTVQLNVGNLPNGIYVLHVHDGTENPPLTQRIVISH